MTGSHLVVVPSAVRRRVAWLARHHRHPGIGTAFDDAVAVLQNEDLTDCMNTVNRLMQHPDTRVPGPALPWTDRPPVVVLRFDVDATAATVSGALFPEMPPPRSTNKVPVP